MYTMIQHNTTLLLYNRVKKTKTGLRGQKPEFGTVWHVRYCVARTVPITIIFENNLITQFFLPRQLRFIPIGVMENHLSKFGS